MNVRYLNERKIVAEELKKKALLITSMVIGDFFLFGLVDSVMDYNSFNIGMSVFFLILNILIFLKGISIGKRCDRARRYESIFGSDEDGIVTIGEISTMMQVQDRKVYYDVKKLFKKKFFINCNFDMRGNPAVVMYDVTNVQMQNMNPEMQQQMMQNYQYQQYADPRTMMAPPTGKQQKVAGVINGAKTKQLINQQNVNNGVGFVQVICPNCGTMNRLRAGSMGKCVACQAPVKGEVR